MHVILASGHPEGVMDALKDSPWYWHLAAAALLGGAAYGLREIDQRREDDSVFLELVIFLFAIAAVILAYQGVFGTS